MKQKMIALSIAILLQIGVYVRYYIKAITADEGNCTGMVEVEAEGQTGPFTYLWSHGSEGKVLNQLCAGSYEVEVINRYQCSTVLKVDILKKESPLFKLDATPSCADVPNGSAAIELNSATKNLTIKWDSGSTKTQRNKLSVGEHCFSLLKTTDLGEYVVDRHCLNIKASEDCDKTAELIFDFTVNPNPFSEKLVINIGRASQQMGNGILYVYNATGKEVMRQELQLQPGQNTVEINNQSNLPNGIYNLKYREKGMLHPKVTQIIKIN